jgi:hypothetical protein
MTPVPMMPLAVESGIVFIFFLPGEIAPGDYSLTVSRGENGLLLTGDNIAFAVNLEAEYDLRAAREVVLVKTGEAPARLGSASLVWP